MLGILALPHDSPALQEDVQSCGYEHPNPVVDSCRACGLFRPVDFVAYRKTPNGVFRRSRKQTDHRSDAPSVDQ